MRLDLVMKMLACAAALICLLVGGVAGGVANAAADKPEDLAQTAAESWLKTVDVGRYDDSWTASAKLFQGAVTKDQWHQAAAAARGPLGDLVSRKVKSRQYTATLPGAPDGKYVVIQFDALYKAKASAVETVTVMLDPDSVWRVSGYFIK
jgi:hypothetical protein